MSKPDLRTQFWMDAYLTSLGLCAGPDDCKANADAAVRQLSIFQHLPYSQNEGGNIPYAPRDEVAGCLRGAITAMNVLRVELIDRSLTSLCPGLDDLIARSKKALGDC